MDFQNDDWKISGSTWSYEDTDTEIKTDGNVGLGVNSPDYILDVDGSISVGGPDEEEREKLEELAQKQREKVSELKDHIIKYLSENNIGYSRTKQWKSDLNTIEKMKRELEGPDQDGQFQIYPAAVPRILDPDEMRKLNDIYERWS